MQLRLIATRTLVLALILSGGMFYSCKCSKKPNAILLRELPKLGMDGSKKNAPKKWAAYYNDKAGLDALAPFSLLVLDSQVHPNLRPLQDRNKEILGYVSLGEVELHRPYFANVKRDGILLQENKDWKGSFFVDLRDARWAKRVIEQIIPKILHDGFDGLFLDTLDNAGFLERSDPKKFSGMIKAAANLVKAIKHHYPDVKLMMNRGYELLPMVAGIIDMELGESIYSDYNFDTKSYAKVPTELYQEQVQILKRGKAKNPSLKIYTLDYWFPNDKKQIKKIYDIERSNGFIPYVANVELDEVIEEPT